MSSLQRALLVSVVLASLVALGGCAGTGQRPLSTEVAGAPGMPTDKKFLTFLDEERAKPNGKGLVLLSAIEGRCDAGTVSVGQTVDGRYKQVAVIRGYGPRMLAPARFEPHALPAGDYLVGDAAVCGRILQGPHARFTVRAGELVDVGLLRFDVVNQFDLSRMVSGRGLVRRSVEPLDPGQVDRLRQEAPALMTKVVRRPMALAGAAEAEIGIRQQHRAPVIIVVR